MSRGQDTLKYTYSVTQCVKAVRPLFGHLGFAMPKNV